MAVLVTGGAGFIGSSIVNLLADAGQRVCVLDARRTIDHRRREVEVVAADLRDRRATAAALHDVEVVCHQAAMVGLGLGMEDAPDYVGCNDLATAVLLAEMERRGVQQLEAQRVGAVGRVGKHDARPAGTGIHRKHRPESAGPPIVPGHDVATPGPPMPAKAH